MVQDIYSLANGWVGVRSGEQRDCTVRLGSRERGRDGPEAPSMMLAQHGSSLPGLGVRREKSEKTNLPVDLSGEIWIVFLDGRVQ